MRPAAERVLISVALAISLVIFGLQAFVLRPHLWPAGAGLALSGDVIMGALAAPQPIAVIRPPSVPKLFGEIGTVERVSPGGGADQAGIRAGDRVKAIKRPGDRFGVV